MEIHGYFLGMGTSYVILLLPWNQVAYERQYKFIDSTGKKVVVNL